MYDTADSIWQLLVNKFPNLTDEQREYVEYLTDRTVSASERKAARDLLRQAIGIDPMFEVDWARIVADDPALGADADRLRRLLYEGYYNKKLATEARVEFRKELAEELGRDPLANDGPMHDWES